MKNELAEANKELGKLAHHDGLTQILNRRGFDEAIDRHWRQTRRDKSQMAFLLVDIDHFKLYNDHYGHLAGDDCLKTVAQFIAEKPHRPLDITARYGGEEFALILPNTPIAGAELIAKRITQGVCNLAIPHEASTTSDVITISVGICMASQAESASQLIQQADEGLYAAKHGGRNQFCIWPKPNT